MKRRIEDYVEYDETLPSCLKWKKSPNRSKKVGEECFNSIQKGREGKTPYYKGGFNHETRFGHQVVWYLHHKEWSTIEFPINHIDGNGLNNKIENLERVSGSDNRSHKNRRLHRNNKSSEVRGVYPTPVGNYSVRFKGTYRGRKDTLEEGIELWNKCYELDRQGIYYKEVNTQRDR